MKVLVLGANGFIGRYLCAMLRENGHQVVGASRHVPDDMHDIPWWKVDIQKITHSGQWEPVLKDIDWVINTIGVFNEARTSTYDRLHVQLVSHLADACIQAGIQGLIHFSAQGAAPNAPTEYWRSKGRGEQVLLAKRLNGRIVRPSLVYGPEGSSSRLFTALSSLPVWLLPKASRHEVNPLHIHDLAYYVCSLIDQHPTPIYAEDIQGPAAMPLVDYLQTLRTSQGWQPATTLFLPDWLANPLATVAGWLPGSVVSRNSLTMLTNPPVHDPNLPVVFTQQTADTFAGPAQALDSLSHWLHPLTRGVMAFLWIWTALVTLFWFDARISLGWLAQTGIPASWQPTTLVVSCLLDAGIGAALLLWHKRWLWPLQLAVILGYSVILTAFLPATWFHPFGVVSKNLPILLLILAAWVTENRR